MTKSSRLSQSLRGDAQVKSKIREPATKVAGRKVLRNKPDFELRRVGERLKALGVKGRGQIDLRLEGSLRLQGPVNPLVTAVLLGLAGLDRSGVMPSLIHQTESWKSLMRAVEAKACPLSERMRSGKPLHRVALEEEMGVGHGERMAESPSPVRNSRLNLVVQVAFGAPIAVNGVDRWRLRELVPKDSPDLGLTLPAAAMYSATAGSGIRCGQQSETEVTTR